jgi:hypothetical protein
MNKQKSAFYNGITFVDIDKQIDLPTDFETDRIPNKGDVMCFNSIKGEIFETSIYVVTKKIEPELGEKTWKSILENI